MGLGGQVGGGGGNLRNTTFLSSSNAAAGAGQGQNALNTSSGFKSRLQNRLQNKQNNNGSLGGVDVGAANAAEETGVIGQQLTSPTKPGANRAGAGTTLGQAQPQ